MKNKPMDILRNKCLRGSLCRECGKFIEKGEPRLQMGEYGFCWSISFHLKCVDSLLDRIKKQEVRNDD